jgi:hypothetical protein
MNERFEPLSIHGADRTAIEVALTAPGSKARNERGALSIAKFKSLGHQVWKEGDPVPTTFPSSIRPSVAQLEDFQLGGDLSPEAVSVG